MKSCIQSINFDFWDIITNDPSIPSGRRDDENIVIKSKYEYTWDDYKTIKKIRESYIFYNVL